MQDELDPRPVLADLRWLAGLARALVTDPSLADDACQEVWLAAGRSGGPGWRPTRAWLAGALRRSVASARRSAARRREREERAAGPGSLPSPDELVERTEVQQVVARELLQLEEPFRSALLLRFQEGLEPAEIARRSGCPADTVRWRVRRGLELLSARLERRRGSDWRAWVLFGLPPALRDAPVQAPLSIGALVMSVKGLSIAAGLVAVVCGVVLLSEKIGGPSPDDAGRLATPEDEAPESESASAAGADLSHTGAREAVAVDEGDALPTVEPVTEPQAEHVGLVVRGRVLSPDGVGVTGATVCTGSLASLEILRLGRQPEEELREARTGEEGGFLLEGLGPGALRIVAGWAKHAASEELVLDVGGAYGGEEVELWLRVGARIHGEVVRLDGAPMSETSLRFRQPETELMRMRQTDAQGRFDERALHPGEWELVSVPDASIVEELGGSIVDHLAQKIVTVGDGEELFVSLGGPPPPGVLVRGRVTQGGAPVQGNLHWMAEGADSASNQKFLEGAADGSYEVELQRAGPWFVKVTGEAGHQEFRVDVPKAGETTLDFELPTGRLEGTVVDSEGRAVPRARVSLFLEEGAEYRHDMSCLQDQRRTKGDGSFAYSCLPPGLYVIAAEDEEGRRALAMRRGLALGEGAVLDDLRLVLGGGHSITGRVTDSLGLPAAEAPLWIYDENGHLVNPITAARTDASGAFRTGPLRPGKYTIHCRLEDEALLSSAAVRFEGEAAELSLQLEPGAELSVVALGPDGEPLRAQIRVHDLDGRVFTGLRDRNEPWAWQRRGMDSRLARIGPLPPGGYVVTAAVQGRATASQTVSLTARESRELRLLVE